MSELSSHGHEHVFLGAQHRRNERRVWMVIALTATMMVVEIVAGSIYGSMALLADGWHMSTHAAAMLITALAYLYARRQARNARFTFGPGKVGDLAGFASAVVLALVALMIGWESVLRLASPVAIGFEQAIAVAAVGLAVNLVSAWLLRDDHGHPGHGHGHHGHGHQGHGHQGHGDHGHRDHTHRHAHDQDDHHDHDGPAHHHDHGDHTHPRRHVAARDNNLRAAYLHVLADALTSVLAIVALLLGRVNGWLWADPLIGVVGAVVIARWSWLLIRDTGGTLLDAPADGAELREEIAGVIERDGDRITDLHVWQVGPGHHAAIVSLLSPEPRTPAEYKARLAHISQLSHLTVEVQPAS